MTTAKAKVQHLPKAGYKLQCNADAGFTCVSMLQQQPRQQSYLLRLQNDQVGCLCHVKFESGAAQNGNAIAQTHSAKSQMPCQKRALNFYSSSNEPLTSAYMVDELLLH